ncbi:TcmI family type II polyketide cyclase, partial [Streptomyces sp. NPDC002920]
PRGPVLRSTIFQRDDVVVRLVDVRHGLGKDPAKALAPADTKTAAQLKKLLESAPGPAPMTLVTDRRSPDA